MVGVMPPQPRVIPVTFEGLVEYVCSAGNPNMGEVRRTLEHWGVPVHGDYRLYWPRDSQYIAYSVSEAFCAIIVRLLSDARVATYPPAPAGAVAEYSLPRREFASSQTGHGMASEAQVQSGRIYARDREVHLVFTSAGPSVSRTYFDDVDPDDQYHYVG